MKVESEEKHGLPQSLLDKIYDSTGSISGGNRSDHDKQDRKPLRGDGPW